VSKSTGEAVPTTRPGLSGTTADAPGSAANNPACPGGVTSHQRRRLQAEVQHPLGVILEQVPCLLKEHRELGTARPVKFEEPTNSLPPMRILHERVASTHPT